MRNLVPAVAGALLLPFSLRAQQLTATELGIGPTAAVARETFVGAELGVSRRTASTSRLAMSLAAGVLRRQPAARAQLTLQFLVNPFTRTGLGLYGGLGAAFTARRGAPSAGFVAVLLGLEAAPGGRSGWYLEAGIGGGVRASLGWRARWFPPWWRR